MPLNPLTDISKGLTALPAVGAGDGSSQPSGNPSTAPAPGPDWLTGTVAKYTTILLGLILIAAGIFSFKSVQQVTGAAVKVAAA